MLKVFLFSWGEGGGQGQGVCFLGISFSLLPSIHSRMDSIYWAHLVLVLCLGVFVNSFCQGESDANFTAVYIVSLRKAPSAHYSGELTRDTTGFKHASPGRLNIHKQRYLFSFVSLENCGVIMCSIQQIKLIAHFNMYLKKLRSKIVGKLLTYYLLHISRFICFV